MNDIPDYIDGNGRGHLIRTLQFNHNGTYFNGYDINGTKSSIYWISVYSLEKLSPVQLHTWHIVDMCHGHYSIYHPYDANVMMEVAHLGQKMSKWIQDIYPDLGWIIAEYAFDLRYVPAIARIGTLFKQ